MTDPTDDTNVELDAGDQSRSTRMIWPGRRVRSSMLVLLAVGTFAGTFSGAASGATAAETPPVPAPPILKFVVVAEGADVTVTGTTPGAPNALVTVFLYLSLRDGTGYSDQNGQFAFTYHSSVADPDAAIVFDATVTVDGVESPKSNPILWEPFVEPGTTPVPDPAPTSVPVALAVAPRFTG